jgi:hypothetical protein
VFLVIGIGLDHRTGVPLVLLADEQLNYAGGAFVILSGWSVNTSLKRWSGCLVKGHPCRGFASEERVGVGLS